MKKQEQEQENVAPRPISRSDVAAYFGKPESGFRDRLFVIIFEAETRAGRRFDFSLIAAILLSVVVVMLDSVSGINYRYGGILNALEWFFTVAFTIEYMVRILRSAAFPHRSISPLQRSQPSGLAILPLKLIWGAPLRQSCWSGGVSLLFQPELSLLK